MRADIVPVYPPPKMVELAKGLRAYSLSGAPGQVRTFFCYCISFGRVLGRVVGMADGTSNEFVMHIRMLVLSLLRPRKLPVKPVLTKKNGRE